MEQEQDQDDESEIEESDEELRMKYSLEYSVGLEVDEFIQYFMKSKQEIRTFE